MPTNMTATIRRLTMIFIVLLLAVSAVAAYVQVSNQAFIDGPTLAQGSYDPRKCPPYDAPLRGTIYDRNGIALAWMAPDSNATCGYKRVYSPDAVNAGLGPLLGYYSYKYGKAGIESSYNDYLAGIAGGTGSDDLQRKILHEPRYGNDLYLTIDLHLQAKANANYDNSARFGKGAPGGLVLENPFNGEVLALVSRPTYDPNQVDDPAYFQKLNTDPNAPVLDHATQGLYVPGSTFKTLTLIADLDGNGADLTAKTYDQDSATHYAPDGYDFKWVDYLRAPNSYADPSILFPMSLQDGYAQSDNTIFARAAVDVGKDKWLSYAEKFGIAVPGANVPAVPFDAPYAQSSVYPALTNGKPTTFDTNLLAASGFGQGDLLISPLTMAEITGVIATGGHLFDPHVVKVIAAHADNAPVGSKAPKQLTPPSPATNCGDALVTPPCNVKVQEYGDGGSIFQRGDTGPKMRAAMWAVASAGTGVLRGSNGLLLADQPIKEGGKTGTGEAGDGSILTTWWISLAPDDQAPDAGGPPQLVCVIEKAKSGEGAYQVFVANDTYEAARQLGYLKI